MISKEELERLYWDEGLSHKEISEKIDVSRSTVSKWCRDYNIKTRKNLKPTKKELKKLYWEDGLTQKEIGKNLGIAHSTVSTWMNRLGIETKGKYYITEERLKNLYIDQELSDKEIAKLEKVSRTTIADLRGLYGIERQVFKISKKELKKLYIEKGLVDKEIAKIKGVAKSTITKWRHKYNINRKRRIMTNREKINEELKKKSTANHLVQIKKGYKYKGHKKKLELICSCGHEYASSYKVIKQYIREHGGFYHCPMDRERKVWNYKAVKNLFEKHDCKLISKNYKNPNQKLKFICHCGNEYSKSLNQFKGSPRCYECGNKLIADAQSFDYEYVKKYFEEHNCKLLSKTYKNAQQGLEYICECGDKSIVSFSHFKAGRRCKKCGIEKRAEQHRHDYDYVKKYFKKHGCELLSKEYINTKEKMKYICSCGNVSEIDFDHFKQGNRCGKCRESKGERIINKWLEDKGFEFEREVTFPDCILTKHLRYDFGILNNNGKFQILIGYHGKQHYEVVEYFGGKEGFKLRKERDKKKRKYAKDNGIKFLEIPYWKQNNIEEILERELTAI